jgi:hypothetical protein
MINRYDDKQTTNIIIKSSVVVKGNNSLVVITYSYITHSTESRLHNYAIVLLSIWMDHETPTPSFYFIGNSFGGRTAHGCVRSQ